MFLGNDLQEMVELLKETIRSVDNVSSSIGGVNTRLDNVIVLLEGVNKRLDMLLVLFGATIAACAVIITVIQIAKFIQNRRAA